MRSRLNHTGASGGVARSRYSQKPLKALKIAMLKVKPQPYY
ncbi:MULTISPECIES: hypothetical protein [Cyanophyceae]|nr:hypothetical protein [Trichocoleus sp. FACHB-69]